MECTKTMKTELAVREIKRWISKFDYVHNLEIGDAKVARGKCVKFVARTTKTRASSIVSRIEHIVFDVVEDRAFTVIKTLQGLKPATRGDLADWSIEVFIPTARSPLKAAA